MVGDVRNIHVFLYSFHEGVVTPYLQPKGLAKVWVIVELRVGGELCFNGNMELGQDSLSVEVFTSEDGGR